MFVLAWKLLALLSISLKLSFENWGEGIHSDSSNAPSCTYQSHPSIELSLKELCFRLAILNGIFVFLFFSWFCLAGRFYCRSTQREFGKVVCFGHTRNIDRAVARRWFSIVIIIISIVIITIITSIAIIIIGSIAFTITINTNVAIIGINVTNIIMNNLNNHYHHR